MDAARRRRTYCDVAQEIAGEVSVVMTLQPTFSIEFIQVTMFLR